MVYDKTVFNTNTGIRSKSGVDVHPMKILQIITELGGGGAEKIIAMLSEGLAAAGDTLTVVSLLKEPPDTTIPDRLRSAGIEVIFLNGKKLDPFLLLRLRRIIKRISPDVIHAHLMHPNLLSRLASAGLKIPLVNTIHTAEKRAGKKKYFLLDRLTWHLADCVTAVSASAATFHRQACGLKKTVNIRIIPNAVEPVVPAPEELCRSLRDQWCAGADKIIGCVGRLDAMKGFDVMLDRLEPLSRLIPDGEKWLLLVLGDGPDREKLERKAAGLRYENLKIVFAGFRNDAASLMNLFDVFLSPSFCEGYGLAAAEAMTLGLPVVCNRIDALPELCQAYNGDSFLFSMEEDVEGTEMAVQLLSASECERSGGMVLMDKGKMVQMYRRLYEALFRRRKN